jgi:phage terminase large subunit-like protein
MDLKASDLRGLSKEELTNLFSELKPKEIEQIIYNWEFWARPNQLEPLDIKDGKKDTWVFNAGRGSGKTRAGAEWVRHRVKSGDKRIACVAPTNSDIRKVMIEGESGLLNVCWSGDVTYRGAKMGYPEWSPTNRTLIWANGARAEFFSAEDPERLRGPQFHAAWCDEVAAWRNMRDVWDMLQFCLRLGKHPKVLVTTTPKPVSLMRELIKSPKSHVTSGSTYDNIDNLAPAFIEKMRILTREQDLAGRNFMQKYLMKLLAPFGLLKSWTGVRLRKTIYRPILRE